MAMLIVQDIQGHQQPLMVHSLHITKQLNTLTQIEFSTVNTDDNLTAFEMIQPRSIFIDPVDGEIYRISQKNGQELGDLYQLQITALQILTDLSDKYIKDVMYNTQSLESVMSFITKDTRFSYSLHGNFANHDFGSKGSDGGSPFGNALAYDLFINSVVKDYNVEWSCHGYHIDLYNQIGSENQFVCVDKDDVYALQETADFTTLKTQIYGIGKTDDNGNPTVSTTYTSPNSKQFGIIQASPYSDDRCNDVNTLTNELKKQLQDYPLVQYQTNVNKFKEYADGLSNNYEIGNYGIVRSRWGIDITTRISKLDIYRDTPETADVITFGNLQLDPSKVMVKLEQAHNKLVNDVGSIRNQESSGTTSTIKVDNEGLSGSITISLSSGIVYVDLAMQKLKSLRTLTILDESYRPKSQRTGNFIASSDKNYIVNYVVQPNGEFNILSISDLSGTPVNELDNPVNGNFNYLI